MSTIKPTDVSRVIVVDDESPARMRLCAMVNELEAFQIVAEANNGEQALLVCEQHRPDLVLMDIRMPGMDGLQAASMIAEQPHPPAVIFCTAYDEHALAAFEASAVGYLLKPVKAAQLQAALVKASQLNRAQLGKVNEAVIAKQDEAKIEHIVIRTTKGEERIPVSEIRALVADKKYVSAYIKDREVILDQSLKTLEAQYPERFIRVHRNALVAPDYIIALEKVALEKSRLNEGSERLQQHANNSEHKNNEASLCVRLKGTDVMPQVSRRLVPSIRRLLRVHE